MPLYCPPNDVVPRFPPSRIVNRERARPRTLIEVARVRDMLCWYMVYEILYWNMAYATQEAYKAMIYGEIVASYRSIKNARWGIECRVVARHRRSPAQAALEAYLFVMRNAPIIYGTYASRREGPPGERRLEEAAAGILSSWVRSGLKQYGDLQKALSEEGSPEGVLIRELPGAVLAEYAEMYAENTDPSSGDQTSALREQVREPYKELRNRVANRLRTSGGEAERLLQHSAKLAQPEADFDLEDFELRETLRQQLRQLEALEQTAGLSPQQMDVWRLAREGKDNAEIAAQLGVGKNQVSVVLHNAKKKLVEARKVAGF